MAEGAEEKAARPRAAGRSPAKGGPAKKRTSNRLGTGTGPGTGRRGERRRQLLEAAVELFSARPYEDIFIADIADAAGVAHGLLFYYFKDKRGIYLEALGQVARDIQDYQRPRPDEVSAEARLYGMVRRHFEYIGGHTQTFIGFMRTGLGDPDVRRIFESARQAGVDLVLDLFEIESEPPPPILRAALRGWVGYLDEISLDWLAYRDVPVEDVVQLSIDTLIAGLRSVEGRHSDITAMLRELNRAA
ncbi:TetR/AcrR family transcriptional regulator [Embleya scabrispora]|uniref:TetR/AcrR family transcriptional regulator n=1 Tax=Embleya scabrispora TaxID=159449 RepID=UPI000365A3E0|nr:TetR/AcrR family transcriptional regulator [Embleya scabrispora]MYS82728.1 TetR family transcriptional regulator [Streptomyces sp. SID5474]